MIIQLVCCSCGERCTGQGECGGDHEGDVTGSDDGREAVSHQCSECGRYTCGRHALELGHCPSCTEDVTAESIN